MLRYAKLLLAKLNFASQIVSKGKEVIWFNSIGLIINAGIMALLANFTLLLAGEGCFER
jgi:hypothetical protein